MNTKNNENEQHDRTDLLLEEGRIALHDAQESIKSADSADNLETEWAAAIVSLDELIARREEFAVTRKSARTEAGLKIDPQLESIQDELTKLNQTLRKHYGARTKITFQPDSSHDFRHSFFWAALGAKAREAVTRAVCRFVKHDNVGTVAFCRRISDALAFVRGVNEQLAAAPSAGRP
jgi:hypothetical protein